LSTRKLENFLNFKTELKIRILHRFNSWEMLYQLAYDRAARKMISDSLVNKELMKNNENI